MPTLFTALQKHLSRRAAPPRIARPAAESLRAEVLGTAAVAATKALPTRKRGHLKNPQPHLSLCDRFTIRPLSGKRHVIVVGAGFAGLAAAYELKSVGYQVTVLEGRSKVGGRVLSRDDVVPESIVEHGAELIGRNHLARWSYARKFRLRLDPLTESDNASPIVLGGHRLSPSQTKVLAREMHRGARLINNAARSVNAYEPWLTRNAHRLNKKNLDEGLKRLRMSRMCRLAYREQLEADNGVEAVRQSWLGNLAMIKGGGLARYWRDSETHRCRGGNQKLAFELEAAIGGAKTGRKVRRIEIDTHGVTVKLERGKPLRGSDVVLAVPPTMWRRVIRIEPPLPKRYAVQFGRNVKYILNVRSGSWDPESPDMSSDGPIDITWLGTAHPKNSRAGVVAFSGADNADTCRAWNSRRMEYLKHLEPIYPRLRASALNGKFMNWLDDPWTLGSYSFPKPGEVTRVGPLLHRTFRRRLHFAGEHTCYAFTGYMEGALRSGLRVAEQIARRDKVI
jgi:monoamine oxidase